mmetsp:Transcript_43889/g.73090  ORF Transcript_43889/g.73090 Transcript_43889/m.73090 type:complete len:229 (+) Transcript_43889:958-1644(+)
MKTKKNFVGASLRLRRATPITRVARRCCPTFRLRHRLITSPFRLRTRVSTSSLFLTYAAGRVNAPINPNVRIVHVVRNAPTLANTKRADASLTVRRTLEPANSWLCTLAMLLNRRARTRLIRCASSSEMRNPLYSLRPFELYVLCKYLQARCASIMLQLIKRRELLKNCRKRPALNKSSSPSPSTRELLPTSVHRTRPSTTSPDVRAPLSFGVTGANGVAGAAMGVLS